MTPEDIGNLTLAELEAIAARTKAAAETLQSALGLMRGAVPAQPQPAQVPSGASTAAPSRISPEAQAELDAWRNGSARKKLLEQIRDDSKDELPEDIARAEARQ